MEYGGFTMNQKQTKNFTELEFNSEELLNISCGKLISLENKRVDNIQRGWR